MPNQWSHGIRKMYESATGARTIDTEFNLKVEECKMVEHNLRSIQRLFREFYSNTRGKIFF